MMRLAASAALVGALIAAGASYSSRVQSLRALAASWLDVSAPTAPVTGSWPVCTSMATMGTEAEWAQLDPDFAAGKRALVAGDWLGAVAALKLAVLRDPGNADIHNYIGFAYRRLQQFGPAMQHYQQALVLNRRHRGAHEHLGELYLALGARDMAEQHLAMLEKICLIPCAETDELKSAMAAGKAPTIR
jgi:tetratricopeptide (TPR) repeat protein